MAAATSYFLTSPTNLSKPRSEQSSRSSSCTTSVQGENATCRKQEAMDDISETSSFVSMDKFMSAQAKSPSSSKRQAMSSKLREWRSESYKTWKKVQPYYEEVKYWVMMGPH